MSDLITREEYEEAQNIVWDYEEQLQQANGVTTGEKQCNLPIVMPSTLPDPQQWFMNKYDVDINRMQLIEHKGNDVVRFIYAYLNDLK